LSAAAQLVRRHAMKGHLLSKKAPKRKRFLSGEAVVERCDINNAKDCLVRCPPQPQRTLLTAPRGAGPLEAPGALVLCRNAPPNWPGLD
jgi:ribosomal protein L35